MVQAGRCELYLEYIFDMVYSYGLKWGLVLRCGGNGIYMQARLIRRLVVTRQGKASKVEQSKVKSRRVK